MLKPFSYVKGERVTQLLLSCVVCCVQFLLPTMRTWLRSEQGATWIQTPYQIVCRQWQEDLVPAAKVSPAGALTAWVGMDPYVRFPPWRTMWRRLCSIVEISLRYHTSWRTMWRRLCSIVEISLRYHTPLRTMWRRLCSIVEISLRYHTPSRAMWRRLCSIVEISYGFNLCVHGHATQSQQQLGGFLGSWQPKKLNCALLTCKIGSKWFRFRFHNQQQLQGCSVKNLSHLMWNTGFELSTLILVVKGHILCSTMWWYTWDLCRLIIKSVE